MAAVEFAYANLRLNRSDPAAWKAVIDSFLPIYGEVPLGTPDVAGDNTAVRYREGEGPSHWAVFEELAPDLAQAEYPPKHALAVAMRGKRVGDTFDLRSDGVPSRQTLPSRRYIIEEILSKYVYHYHRCLDSWERTFPGAPGPQMVPIPEDVEELLKTLEPALAARAERAEELLNFYRTSPALSLYMWGRAQNMTIFSAMQNLATSTETDVRCTMAPQDDLAGLARSLDESPELILDSTALATLLLLDQLSVLESLGLPVVVASGVVDELRRHRQEAASTGTGGALSLERGRVVFHMVYETTRETYLQRIDTAIEWLEKWATIFTEPRSSLSERDWRVWITLGGSAAAESLQRALRTKACLWTDDASIAGFASQKGASAVWTQLVLGWAMEKRRIERALLDNVTARLVGWRFVPTQLRPQVYAAAVAIAKWDPTAWPMPEHLRLIEHSAWPTVEVVALVAGTLRLWWSETLSDVRATALTMALLDRVVARMDGELIINALFRLLPKAFGLDVMNRDRALEVLRAWAVTHGELSSEG